MITIALLLACPHDQLLVSSFTPAAVQAFDPESGAHTGTIGAGSPLTGTLGSAIGPDGLLYVASEGTDEVLRFEPSSGAYVDAVVSDDPATAFDETGGLVAPSGIAFGPDGKLYVGSFSGDSILRYDGRSGAFIDVFVSSASGNLNGPDAGMAFGPSGDLYVPSFWNRRVKRYDGASGAFVENAFTPANSSLRNPRAVLFLDDGTALVTSEGSDQVLCFDTATGDFLDVLIGDDPSTAVDESGGLDGPSGIVRRPDGSLLVASVQTHEVKRYSAMGDYLGEAVSQGAGGIATPVHLTQRPNTDPGCPGQSNSAGAGATLVARGTTQIAVNDLHLELSYAPAATTAILIQGTSVSPIPVGNGTLCLGTPLFRIGLGTTDSLGRTAWPLTFGQPTAAGASILAGSSWSFQAGFRDAGGSTPAALNFSSSLLVHFDA